MFTINTYSILLIQTLISIMPFIFDLIPPHVFFVRKASRRDKKYLNAVSNPGIYLPSYLHRVSSLLAAAVVDKVISYN